MRHGHTLLELAVVLSLTALLGSAILPAAGRFRDGRAADAARESMVGLLAEARLRAVASGGAEVHLAGGPWRAWLEANGVTLRTVRLEEELDVTVELSRARTSTTIVFDAMGLGRLAGETLRFRRADAVAALVVSGYGRVRRP